jgi:hypothetical protein
MILGVLRGEARRNLARSLFPGFWERGISANQALRELREMGLGYRRTDFLRDYREGRETWFTKGNLRFLDPDKRPDVNRLEKGLIPTGEGFGFQFRMTFFDTQEGVFKTKYPWYYTDKIGTRRELESSALGVFREREGVSYIVIVGMDLWRGRVNIIEG